MYGRASAWSKKREESVYAFKVKKERRSWQRRWKSISSRSIYGAADRKANYNYAAVSLYEIYQFDIPPFFVWGLTNVNSNNPSIFFFF